MVKNLGSLVSLLVSASIAASMAGCDEKTVPKEEEVVQEDITPPCFLNAVFYGIHEKGGELEFSASDVDKTCTIVKDSVTGAYFSYKAENVICRNNALCNYAHSNGINTGKIYKNGEAVGILKPDCLSDIEDCVIATGRINLTCTKDEVATYTATVSDKAGNTSSSEPMTFYCKNGFFFAEEEIKMDKTKPKVELDTSDTLCIHAQDEETGISRIRIFGKKGKLLGDVFNSTSTAQEMNSNFEFFCMPTVWGYTTEVAVEVEDFAGNVTRLDKSN